MGRIKGWLRVENTDNVELSQVQKETLYYLTEEFLSITKIAKIKGRTEKAVYKTISQLKKKGVLVNGENNNFKKGGQYLDTPCSDKKKYRLHKTNFEIKILDKSSKFYELYEAKNIKHKLDNNTVTLCKEKIIVYMNKDFWGENVNECENLMLDYLFRFVARLENTFKILLYKNNFCKIYQFSGEIARVGDNIAKKYNIEQEKLQIRDDNGRLRLIVDRSSPYGIKWDELEAVNKDFHNEDMRKIDKFLKDIITKDTLVLSEVTKHIIGLQHSDNISKDRFERIEHTLEQLVEIQKQNTLMIYKINEKFK